MASRHIHIYIYIFHIFFSFLISFDAQLANVLARLHFDFLPRLTRLVIASFSNTGTNWTPKHETKSLFIYLKLKLNKKIKKVQN